MKPLLSFFTGNGKAKAVGHQEGSNGNENGAAHQDGSNASENSAGQIKFSENIDEFIEDMFGIPADDSGEGDDGTTEPDIADAPGGELLEEEDDSEGPIDDFDIFA